MDNQQFDVLIPEISKKLLVSYSSILETYSCFNETEDVDSSPFLNMTLSVFVGTLLNFLDLIKENTEGEYRLFENIELAKNSIIKAVSDLPFIKKVEFVN